MQLRPMYILKAERDRLDTVRLLPNSLDLYLQAFFGFGIVGGELSCLLRTGRKEKRSPQTFFSLKEGVKESGHELCFVSIRNPTLSLLVG